MFVLETFSRPPNRLLTARTLTFALILIAGRNLFAQSEDVKKDFANKFRGKVVTLRTFSRNNRLQFDLDGQPRTKSEVGPWTVFSQFEVTSIDFARDRLHLSGPRIATAFNKDANKMMPGRLDKELQLDVEINENPSARDIETVLSKIVVGPEGLQAHAPSYWRSYLSGGGGIPRTANTTTYQIAQPQLVRQVRPRYPEEAKQFGLEGYVTFEAEIQEDGTIGEMQILKPAGFGFDECAAEAVAQWKYTPPLVEGKPVRVITTITVNLSFAPRIER